MVTIFRDVGPWSLVGTYQGVKGICCLHLRGISSVRKRETASSSESLVPAYQTTRHNIADDPNVNTYRRDNAKSWKLQILVLSVLYAIC
jgi:hypothetical protein